MRKKAILLTGANMPTVHDHPADSVFIHNGIIQAVGKEADLKPHLPAGTMRKDLEGATLLPGLVDGHVHFAATGFLEYAIDCSECETLPELLDAIHHQAQRKAAGELILGLKLAAEKFPRRRNPNLDELEAAAPNNPIYLRHRTGHSSVASRSALALLDFPRGQAGVQLDDHGQPTGYLIAQATQIATQRMYKLNAAQLGYRQAFEAASARAIAAACTCVHALDDLEAVEMLLECEEDLPIRVVPYTQSFDLAAVMELGLPRIGGCHGCALDGDFDMRTAALLTPYLNSDHYGILYHNDFSLQGFVLQAHSEGLQVAFHAVGDRAVEQALSAFEYAQREHPRPDARHRIEHAQLISDEQLERATIAGVVLSIQPAFNHVWDHHTYAEYVGERCVEVDPLARLVKAGLPLVGGSDSTVTELHPLLGIHAALNHSLPSQSIDVRTAVDMFTRGAAYSSFHENNRGSIREGYDADLSILAEDPFTINPEDIKDIEPLMTVVDGDIVFEA